MYLHIFNIDSLNQLAQCHETHSHGKYHRMSYQDVYQCMAQYALLRPHWDVHTLLAPRCNTSLSHITQTARSW